MIKKVFTFTVKGNKKEFNSMKELVNAFMGCPEEGNGVYTDGITVPYEHGNMFTVKEDIKHVFKLAKKRLGVR